MPRSIPIKLIFQLAIVTAIIIACFGALNQQNLKTPTGAPGELTAEDQAWLKQRLVRPPMPLPKPKQARVLLLWRAPLDAPRVRPVINLVDHPEGLDGVYGMDVANTDAIAIKLHADDLRQNLPTGGAWLVVLDNFGAQISSTPILSPATIKDAFEIAKGRKAGFEGTEDPYLDKPAPDFTTTTMDGVPFTLSAMKGHKLLLNFYCGCSLCKAMATQLAKVQDSPEMKGVEVYTITHMTPFRAKQFSKVDSGQRYITLSENGNGIGSLYNSITCPRIWYIGADGKVKYYSHLKEEPEAVVPSLLKALKA